LGKPELLDVVESQAGLLSLYWLKGMRMGLSILPMLEARRVGIENQQVGAWE